MIGCLCTCNGTLRRVFISNEFTISPLDLAENAKKMLLILNFMRMYVAFMQWCSPLRICWGLWMSCNHDWEAHCMVWSSFCIFTFRCIVYDICNTMVTIYGVRIMFPEGNGLYILYFYFPLYCLWNMQYNGNYLIVFALCFQRGNGHFVYILLGAWV